jgi:hypothetical protein
MPLGTSTPVPTPQDRNVVRTNQDYFSVPRKESVLSPHATQYESHGFIPLCSVAVIEKGDEARDYFSKPVTCQDIDEQKEPESPDMTDHSQSSCAPSPRFPEFANTSHLPTDQLTHPSGSPILGRDIISSPDRQCDPDSHQEAPAKLRGGGMCDSMEISTEPGYGRMATPASYAEDTLEKLEYNDQVFEKILTDLENAFSMAVSKSTYAMNGMHEDSTHIGGYQARRSSYPETLDLKDKTKTVSPANQNFSKPFPWHQDPVSSTNNAARHDLPETTEIVEDTPSQGNVEPRVHQQAHSDGCDNLTERFQDKSGGKINEEVNDMESRKAIATTRVGDDREDHTKTSELDSHQPITTSELLAEESKVGGPIVPQKTIRRVSSMPLRESYKLSAVFPEHDTMLPTTGVPQLGATHGVKRERMSGPVEFADDARLYKKACRSHAKNLTNCLQGRVLTIIDASTSKVWVADVPERMLVYFCGPEAVDRLRPKHDRLTDVLEVAASEAEGSSIARIVRFMKRCCLPSSHQSSGELRIPPNLREGLDTIRACRVLGLNADASRIENVIVRDWMGSKDYLMSDATIALVWNGYLGEFRESSLGDAVVWFVLNEVLKDAHTLAEELRWLLEEDEYETLKVRVKREVTQKKWRGESRTAFLTRCKIHREHVEKKKAHKAKEDRERAERVRLTRERNLKELEETQKALTAASLTRWVPTSWSYKALTPSNNTESAVRHPDSEVAIQHLPTLNLKKPLSTTPVLSYWLGGIDPGQLWSGTSGRYATTADRSGENSSGPISKTLYDAYPVASPDQQSNPTLRGGGDTIHTRSPASRVNNAFGNTIVRQLPRLTAKPKKKRSLLELLLGKD